MSEYYAESFLQAAARGNLEECRKCLAQNIDINYTDKEGIPFLSLIRPHCSLP